MWFPPETDGGELPELLSAFISITGWSLWRRRLKVLEQQERENPLLSMLFDQRYFLERAMGSVRAYRRRTGRFPFEPSHSEFYTFSGMVARVHERLSAPGKRRLAGMLRDGLQSEYGLVPLHHELELAANLMYRGFEVTFADIEGDKRFDLLAARDGAEIEIECKTVSGDIGRQIHRRRLYALSRHLAPVIDGALGRLEGGWLLRVVLPDRLRGDAAQLDAIRSGVAGALERPPAGAVADVCEVHSSAFAIDGSPFADPQAGALDLDVIKRFADRRFGQGNANLLALYRPARCAVIVLVESRRRDAVVGGIVRQLKSAAKDQFTRTRPAMLSIRLADLSDRQLMALADRDTPDRSKATGLQVATSDFLFSESRRHIHTIAFSAEGQIISRRQQYGKAVQNSWRRQGAAYVFTNKLHPLAGDSRYSVFREPEPA